MTSVTKSYPHKLTFKAPPPSPAMENLLRYGCGGLVLFLYVLHGCAKADMDIKVYRPRYVVSRNQVELRVRFANIDDLIWAKLSFAAEIV